MLVAAFSRLGHISWRWSLQAWKHIHRAPFLLSHMPSWISKTSLEAGPGISGSQCLLSLSFSESTEGVSVAPTDVNGPEERGNRENHHAVHQIVRTYPSYNWKFVLLDLHHAISLSPAPGNHHSILCFYEISVFLFFLFTYKWYHPILVFLFLAYFT